MDGADGTDPTSDRTARPRTTRRRVLQAAAAGAALSATGLPATAQEEDGEIELGGTTPGWEGRVPEEIEGETNPTLPLVEGTTYTLTWENTDGEPHNFAIEDADGETLLETDIISEEGETQTVEFEATRAMSEYLCEVHPVSMRGDVSIGGESPDDDEEEYVQEPFFPEGATVGVQTVAEGMAAPTDFDAFGEGDDRYLVSDQPGELWLVDGDGRREEPFVDVSDLLVTLGEFDGDYGTDFQDYDERGLLGVETHPEFLDNGLLYLHYSAPRTEDMPDNWDHVEVIAEFQADDALESADIDSERRLLEIESPQFNHDGGPMAFDPDGYLCVPMGDGGGANDEMYGHVDDWYDENAGGNGQDTTESLLGGVLRIDVDEEGEDRPYGIPDDNPLVGEEGHREEYYAWGFRNPFGISFDSQGRMFVADAGQALYEEANIVEAGGNYGWNVKEATHCFSTDDPSNPPEDCPDSTPDDVRGGEELIDPIVEYPHTYEDQSVGIVIAGGHFYEAETVSDLQGKYLFGDWTRDVGRAEPMGRLFAATDPGDGGDELWEMEELQIAGSDDGELHRFVRQFGRDADGEHYVLVNAVGTPLGDTGEVLRIVPEGEGEEIGPPETPAEDDGEEEVADRVEELPRQARGFVARLIARLQRIVPRR